MVKIMPTSEGGWVNYNLGFVVVVIVVLGEGVEKRFPHIYGIIFWLTGDDGEG